MAMALYFNIHCSIQIPFYNIYLFIHRQKLKDFRQNTKKHNLVKIKEWIVKSIPKSQLEVEVDQANGEPMKYAIANGWDEWSYAGKYGRLADIMKG